MKKTKNNIIMRYIFSILLILAGTFLLILFFNFNPEYSIYKIDSIERLKGHIFGVFGLNLSSFIYRWIGFSAFVLSVALIHSGYFYLKRNTRGIKLFLIILFWFAQITIFSTALGIKKGEISDGGGILGAYLLSSLGIPLKWYVKIALLLSFSAFIILVTYRDIFCHVANFITSAIRKLRKKAHTGIKKEAPRREKSSKKRFYLLRKKKDKLPLIQKVYHYEGYSLETDERITLNMHGIKNSTPKIDEIKNPGRNFRGKKSSKRSYEEETQLEIPGITGSSGASDLERFGSKDVYNITGIGKKVLKRSVSVNKKEQDRETQKKAKELERTLKEFGIEAKVTRIVRGPVITRYEIQPAPGVKLNRIINLSDNIALNLSANGVRIQAPIPGKAAVGIEVPNEIREIVTLGDIIDRADRGGELPLILGKDVSGKIVVADLAEMPHLLIAGATGSGKSVCVNSLILSLLFAKSPEEVKFIMIDPKMVELKIYNGIPHLLTEVVTDPRKAAKGLRWVIHEMENRYRMLDEYRVRDIKGYNAKASQKMPYIVVIIDEFANLMAISQKDVEDAVVRLAAMSRAVGIHLIMATQRPSVDVITGLIKANFPYRIAFQVASKTDSRTILDTIGAEKLLGRGDMLFSPAGSMNLVRIQGAYVSENEVIEIVNELKKSSTAEYKDIFEEEESDLFGEGDEDPMYDEAVEIVVKTRRASASFLQRRLKIGYNRAARLIELMEERGIIGPPRGSKPREIYVDNVD